MKGLGFGLERLGILAVSRPIIFSLLLIFMTGLSFAYIPNVKFNGNLLSIIPKQSPQFQVYNNFRQDFRNFRNDIAIIFQSPRMNTASGLSDLQNLSLDISLEESIERSFSIFSFRKIDKSTGETSPFFSADIEDDDEARRTLDALIASYPQAKSFFSKDENTSAIIITLDNSLGDASDKETRAAFAELKTVLKDLAPDDFEIYYSGVLPVGITIFDLLVNDQAKLTLFGLLIGAIVAIVIFRSWVAALLCFFPPFLTSVWAIGLFSILNVPITYLTTILPAIALILAYADGIMLYHYWAKLNAKEPELELSVFKENLIKAIIRVGPASALTSVTTAFALSTFAFSSSESLVEFAKMGVLVVSFAFIAVIISMPLMGLLFFKFGWFKSGKDIVSFIPVKSFVARILSLNAKAVAFGAIILVGILFYIQALLEPEYNKLDYLPFQSEARVAERITNKAFGGWSLVFLSVPVDDLEDKYSDANFNRLGEITDVLEQRFQKENISSLYSVGKDLSKNARNNLVENMEEQGVQEGLQYFSKDGRKMLVGIRISSDRSLAQTFELNNDLRKMLNENLAYGADIIITGYPVLIAGEFYLMIKAMQFNLLLAIVSGVVLIGLATRSVFYSLVAITPNLLPVLIVEFILYMQTGSISFVQVVSLAMGFGVAIDNAVHVINVFHQEELEGRSMLERMRVSLEHVAPALFASMSIICISMMCTFTSSMPIVLNSGLLIITILVIALFTNLIVLPANILTLGKIWKKQV